MKTIKQVTKRYDVSKTSADELSQQICSDFKGIKLIPRTKFKLIPEYMSWLLEGKKCTTVRYRPGGIDIPVALELPLLQTIGNNDNNSEDNSKLIGDKPRLVKILSLEIKPFKLLNIIDAQRDGFSTESELKTALQNLYTPLYGSITDEEYVSIYTLRLIREIK